MTLQQIIICSRFTQVETSFIVSGKNVPVKEADENSTTVNIFEFQLRIIFKAEKA